MSDSNGSGIPYRYQLLSGIGSAVMLLGLIIYNRIDILPVPLPSEGYGVACIAIGVLLIVLSGWLVYRHKLNWWRGQQQDRRP